MRIGCLKTEYVTGVFESTWRSATAVAAQGTAAGNMLCAAID
jgi:hypothetical protein